MTFFDFDKNKIINVGGMTAEYNGCYFDRECNIYTFKNNGYQNPEWYIQQKIVSNADGYFDFSKNMIDVGAYIGIYRWNLPFQKAWLFEPNRESYMYCCANAVLHKRVEDTFIHNEILSREHEVIEFNGYEGISDNMGGAKGMIGEFSYLEKNIKIISKTLDDFLPEFDNIGFIKIDCEGMDWKVIDGLRKNIEYLNHPPILFENWPERGLPGYPIWLNESEKLEKERNENIRKVLGDLGYSILWEWGNTDTHLAVYKS